jgi:hypothetical protein
MVIGAPSHNSPAGNASGAALVFRQNGQLWNQALTITSGVDQSTDELFGGSVAIEGDVVIVGAPGDQTAGRGSGAVYAFQLGDLPEITSQPVSRTILPYNGSNAEVAKATFSVTASGYAPLQYQWRHNGINIPSANQPDYTTPLATVNSGGGYDVAGRYDCVVSNIGGVVTSASAVLTVNTLSDLSQVAPSPAPQADGFLLVNAIPSTITLGWRFVGEQTWHSFGIPVGGLVPSDRMIEFRGVPGYSQPPPQLVQILKGATPPITV